MIELKNDKLGRKELLENIFKFLDNFGDQIDKGLTVVLNGKYGTGKTTLLNFIEEKNKEENSFNVIRYNAWENNIYENPLMPLLYTISKLQKRGKKIREGTVNVLKNIPKAAASTISNITNIDTAPLLEKNSFLEEFDSYNKAINKLKKVLKDYCACRKTVLLVDELDRCLPEYQIKVLETIYHLLNIPNLVTIIALDKEQLECSIKNTFGDSKNTFGYLSKFIDYEVELNEGNTYEYIQTLMKFKCKEGCTDYIKLAISNMFRKMNLSVRNCQNIVNELNIICNEKNKNGTDNNWHYSYPMLIAFILLLKKTNSHLYQKYFCTKRVRSYDLKTIGLSETLYMKFIKDIENDEINAVIKMLKDEHHEYLYEKHFVVHLINSFDRIDTINNEELSKYLKMETSDINRVADTYFGGMESNPQGINDIIKKIQIITLS